MVKKRKGKNGKKSTFEYDFLNALYVINSSNYIDIDHEPTESQGYSTVEISKYNSTMMELTRYRPSPEDQAIVSDAWNNLSPQAKETFLVLSFPTDELSDLIGTPKRKDMTAKSVIKYSEIQGYDPESVLAELKFFARIYIRMLKS